MRYSLLRKLCRLLLALSLQEEVPLTVFIEVECILNAKPQGYVSSDMADPDPVTPNVLLMGWQDASLVHVF